MDDVMQLVRVKPLVWWTDRPWNMDYEFRADTMLGPYRIFRQATGTHAFKCFLGGYLIHAGYEEDACKAAVQAHYDAMVLSLIEPAHAEQPANSVNASVNGEKP